jgi:hypothetical protein
MFVHLGGGILSQPERILAAFLGLAAGGYGADFTFGVLSVFPGVLLPTNAITANALPAQAE